MPTPAFGAAGVEGAPIGSAFTSLLATLTPAGFIAETRNLYVVPFSNEETVPVVATVPVSEIKVLQLPEAAKALSIR